MRETIWKRRLKTVKFTPAFVLAVQSFNPFFLKSTITTQKHYNYHTRCQSMRRNVYVNSYVRFCLCSYLEAKKPFLKSALIENALEAKPRPRFIYSFNYLHAKNRIKVRHHQICDVYFTNSLPSPRHLGDRADSTPRGKLRRRPRCLRARDPQTRGKCHF